MNPYLPVLMFLAFSLVVGVVLSAASYFLGPLRKKKYKGKSDPYECGVPIVTSAKEKMSVKFYLTAIIFILFDIETVFLYLWATVFKDLGIFGLVEIVVFMLILVVGYIYVIKRGALEWEA